jgi:hypothetical protein
MDSCKCKELIEKLESEARIREACGQRKVTMLLREAANCISEQDKRLNIVNKVLSEEQLKGLLGRWLKPEICGIAVSNIRSNLIGLTKVEGKKCQKK